VILFGAQRSDEWEQRGITVNVGWLQPYPKEPSCPGPPPSPPPETGPWGRIMSATTPARSRACTRPACYLRSLDQPCSLPRWSTRLGATQYPRLPDPKTSALDTGHVGRSGHTWFRRWAGASLLRASLMCNCWSGLCQGGPVGVMRVAEQARGKTGSLQPQARAAVLPAPPPRGHVELKRGLAAVRVVSRQKQVCPECRFCTQSIQSL